jgi:2-polyprenyl-3-methyl-5-hydroxy-6-metoxy-1,4-benzoquinol methylase
MFGGVRAMPDPVTCNLCGQNKTFRVLERNHIPYQVLECLDCSLVFVHPHPDPDFIAAHYNKSYYDDWMNEQASRRVYMWAKRLDKIEQFRKGGRLLDVGCGEGLFLQAALHRGWQVDGTELSSYAAQVASDLLGVKIFCCDLNDAPYPMQAFDVITVWHVLEHVRDPMAYLLKIRSLLKSGGLLILAVPNVHNYLMRIAYRIARGHKMTLFSPDDRELHLYHFSPQTIKSYLQKADLECLHFSPDLGIVHVPKKILNIVSLIPYYLLGIKIFDAMEVWATHRFDRET